MDKNSDLYFLNEEEVSASAISEKLFSSALFYGTGCFETMRFENDTLSRYEGHINRLHRGLEYLQLPKHLFPKKDFLKQKITHLINNYSLNGSAAKVRVQCSLIENCGYHLDSNIELVTHIRVSKIQDVDRSVRLLTAKTRVIPSQCRPSDLKLSNMLHYRSAFREAKDQNFDDALLLSVDGYVAETSIANLFWLSGNRVSTPSIDCPILPGIMRDTTIQAIKKSGKLNVEEGKYKKESVLNADLVWISNSVIECQPVVSIDNVELSCNQALLKEISSIVHDFNGTSSDI